MFVHIIQNKNPHLTQRMAVFLVHLIHGLAEAVSLSLVYSSGRSFFTTAFCSSSSLHATFILTSSFLLHGHYCTLRLCVF